MDFGGVQTAACKSPPIHACTPQTYDNARRQGVTNRGLCSGRSIAHVFGENTSSIEACGFASIERHGLLRSSQLYSEMSGI
jgi:hypothetical protein